MSKVFENTLRVRYGETDQMGVVYYGNYALYFEVARTELIRSLGVSYKSLEDDGIMLPVINMNVNYRKSALYDEIISLKTKIIGEIDKKICFETIIYNSKNELVCSSTVELIFVDKTKGKVMLCPKEFKEKLEVFQWK